MLQLQLRIVEYASDEALGLLCVSLVALLSTVAWAIAVLSKVQMIGSDAHGDRDRILGSRSIMALWGFLIEPRQEPRQGGVVGWESEGGEIPECPICLEQVSYAIETSCGHAFCGEFCCLCALPPTSFSGPSCSPPMSRTHVLIKALHTTTREPRHNV